MTNLYPEIEPYAVHRVSVTHPHELYVEEVGNPEGIPIVFLHGGPGAGCETVHRQLFDPAVYRIVLFDQRGCGRSLPHAELTHNSTWDLVNDMEVIRQQLKIEVWALCGGSWGSTLALAYAETHPQRVTGLVLRGVFLARSEDIQWFYQQGASRIFPDYWQDFIAPVAATDRDNMLDAYYRLLTSGDEQVQMRAARAWSVWEGRTASLVENQQVIDHFSDPYAALSIARIECHYFIHHSFLQPDQLIRDIGRIQHIPGYIVHGRYDVICPFDQAWELHKVWPSADLRIMPKSGHSVFEAETTAAVISALSELAVRIKT